MHAACRLLYYQDKFFIERMRDNTKLKKLLVTGVLAALLLACMCYVLSGSGNDLRGCGHDVIVTELPDGYTEFISDSKTDMYQRKFRNDNEIYYENLGKTASSSDTSRISLVTSDTGNSSLSGSRLVDGQISIDDIFPEEKPLPEKQTVKLSYSASRMPLEMTPEERLDYDRQRVEVMKEALGVTGEVTGADVSDVSPVPETGFKTLSSIKSGGIISSLDDDLPTDETIKPVKCMFVRDEKVRSGQRVSIRILEDYRSGNAIVPANTHLAAVCTLSDRLSVRVSSIEMNGAIHALNLVAYDNDGYEGIYCPETSGSKNARTVVGDAISSTSSVIGGLVGRLAGGAVRTGANILRNSSGTGTVNIVSGYEFYLVEDIKR